MPLPEGMLGEGEDVLYDARPSWTALVGRAASVVVVLAAALAVVVVWTTAPPWCGWVLLAMVLLAGGRLGLALARWRATSIAVTTSRVVYRTGVLRRSGREVPITSVQDVSFRQGILERVARAGSVTVESAGERGALPFLDVPRPDRFQSAVNRATSAAHTARGAPRPPERVPADATIPAQIAELAELCRQGILTAGEFARKKAELLDRM